MQTKDAGDFFLLWDKSKRGKNTGLWLFLPFLQGSAKIICVLDKGMPALSLTTLIFFYNTWNVNKKDSLVKCDFISQLSSSIPVPDMNCSPSSAPIPRLWLMLLFSLYDLFWLRVCAVGLDVTESTLWDPHFQTKPLTPAGKWVIMITNSKHQSKTLETSQIPKHLATQVQLHFEKTGHDICSLFESSNKGGVVKFVSWKELTELSIFPKWSANAKEEKHNQLFTKDTFVKINHAWSWLLNSFISHTDYKLVLCCFSAWPKLEVWADWNEPLVLRQHNNMTP